MIDTTAAPSTTPVAPVKRRIPAWANGILWTLASIVLLTVTADLTGLANITATATIQAGLQLAVPLLLAGLGGLWAERAGVVNIGLEGMMILGTWGSAWAGYQWGPWAAVAGGIVFGALGGLLHAVATVTFGVNHIVSGVAINLLGAGVAKYLSTLLFTSVSHNPRQSPKVPGFDTYSAQPLADWLGDLEKQQRYVVSDIAGILHGLLSGVSPLTMITILLVPVSYLLLWRTRFGLRLRSCGENPVAAESLGVNVYRQKYLAVIVSGGFAGLGGAALVLAPGQNGYLENQTNGRGYIGLAAMIFGNWRPGGLLGGAALFGYADGLQTLTDGKTVLGLFYGVALLIWVIALVQLIRRKWIVGLIAVLAGGALYLLYLSIDSLPSELTTYLPHIVTIVVLAMSAQRLRMPAADGLIYRRGQGS
ncbi:simple sugar transport system permease protein [Kutzneria buriramensis]|uniref:Simple sugar transport system permease protein n=1 Tax=Kutzneria buriramensis TaxID=1045776 RepID=A0A3E0IAI8_9PSEU|nr:ABC transporter permease [Kutzneria buriramensis]REH55690.1 simple sugar transport system permease protein [Kutzneria buriramensis]